VPRIVESIVATRSEHGDWHLVPFGLIEDGEDLVVAPFRPSPSIANLERHPFLSAAAPSDVRVIAGCVTGRRDWPTAPCERIDAVRLRDAYGHAELEVVDMADDALRPRFRCRVVHRAAHRPFVGFNRAQAAVLEAAILTTRLHMLAPEKVVGEMAYLAIAVSKTAGPREHEAWTWIEEKVRGTLRLAGPGFLAAASAAGQPSFAEGEKADGDGGRAE
jgi:hypothetical protein